MRRALAFAFLFSAAVAAPDLACAWGRTGHAAVAQIALTYLNPKAAAAVDALLAVDDDDLTAKDFIARASWADALVSARPETAQWHFVDIQLDDPDVDAACGGQMPVADAPKQNCLVRRLETFERELADPGTTPAARLVAFKFVLHLIGDLHQPLHTADNQDLSGSCVRVAYGRAGTVDLLKYWDTIAVETIEPDAAKLASRLSAEITPADRAAWESGHLEEWALESFDVARTTAYAIGSEQACASDSAPVFLPKGYDAAARAATALQLKRAGVRLAFTLNRILGSTAPSATKDIL
ncbi:MULTISPECIES: S1/P1 nuclease [unclassified Caulobacter]|uniref:S1/P1 nuclease n=1 Tax=unclassified Caulobacter TaxID=2648921 RepID=UPI0006FD980C|nr:MULTISPECIES: S1/P1 nuclease [unclassified Caulobacter]KQV55619.1 S1/P1 Nuclease [Caulobacter sp. Root342]KQV63450.1 S1/P1 Nuclease [Caulobacter sp. Root343]